MADSLEVTVEVIIHATENSSRLLEKFHDTFGIDGEEFQARDTTGHYANPITVLGAKLRKDAAQNFIDILLERMDSAQRDVILSQLSERLSGSRLHLRLDKQEFLRRVIRLGESDVIKLGIHTPVYSKKDTEETFRRIFQVK